MSKYPRDKVILFQVRRGPFAPSMSPFALKLETYLRMAEIPYQVRTQNVHVLFYIFILAMLIIIDTVFFYTYAHILMLLN